MDTQRMFFRSQTHAGFAAWPLHNPAQPAYGSWAWIKLSAAGVVFLGQLTPAEIAAITTRYMVWGETLPQTQWALVRGRGSSFANQRSEQTQHINAARSIGV